MSKIIKSDDLIDPFPAGQAEGEAAAAARPNPGSTPAEVAAQVADANAELAGMRALSDATGSGAPNVRQTKLSGGTK